MVHQRIQARINLMKKIFSAFRDAENEGIKDPLKVLKKALEKKTEINAGKSHHMTQKD